MLLSVLRTLIGIVEQDSGEIRLEARSRFERRLGISAGLCGMGLDIG